jgi:isopentenyldiphosphate isomerase
MELFDLVNENDEVIGTTDKPTAHAKAQLHRLVAVYVFNEQGELYVQVHKASGGLYDNSVGGHVIKGEDYDTAVKREAKEELGIDQPLTHVARLYSDEGGYFKHLFSLYECTSDPSWRFIPNAEVEEIIPMKIETIRKMMHETPEKFTTGFVNTMREYCKVKGL